MRRWNDNVCGERAEYTSRVVWVVAGWRIGAPTEDSTMVRRIDNGRVYQ
jgi:hypothetical protein